MTISRSNGTKVRGGKICLHSTMYYESSKTSSIINKSQLMLTPDLSPAYDNRSMFTTGIPTKDETSLTTYISLNMTIERLN